MTWGAGGSVGDRSVTNRLWVRNGVLGQYTDGAVGIYKCPADHFLSQAQKKAGFQERLRSNSMNALFGRSNNDKNDNTVRGKVGLSVGATVNSSRPRTSSNLA